METPITVSRSGGAAEIRFSAYHGLTKHAAALRAAAIFGPVGIPDPWTKAPARPEGDITNAFAKAFSNAFGDDGRFPLPTPFQIPSAFPRRAQEHPPEQPDGLTWHEGARVLHPPKTDGYALFVALDRRRCPNVLSRAGSCRVEAGGNQAGRRTRCRMSRMTGTGT